MADQNRQGRPGRNNELLDAAEELAVGVGRLGYSLLSFGLNLLPAQSRTHMHRAISELSYGFASLPRDFAAIAGAEVERWAADADAAPQATGVAQPHPGAADPAPVRRVPLAPTGEPAAAEPAPTLGAPLAVIPPPPATVVGVGISFIEFDPPGRDVDGEYVVISNGNSVTVELTGWTLRDGQARHSFIFPTFRLAPGAELRVWTKTGANDESNLYWGSRSAIWNNNGDTATLTDAAGAVVSTYSYTGADQGR